MKKVSLFLFACTLWHTVTTAQVHFVYYPSAKSWIDSSSEQQISAFISTLEMNEQSHIIISGHTDADGNETDNLRLSAERAQCVKDFLLHIGVPGNQLVTEYFGETKPATSGSTESEKQKNRRVEIRYESLDVTSSLSAFEVAWKEFTVESNKTLSITLDNKGTVLHIPENCFVDQNNEPLQNCKTTLRYREYRNSADMAFSGIPMDYHEQGQEFLFNSSGMFELSAECNGEPVRIAEGKNMTIDYALARQNPEISFFNLDENSGEWKKIQEIQPNNGQITAEQEITPVDVVISQRKLIVRDYRRSLKDNLKGERKLENIGFEDKAFDAVNSFNQARLLGGGSDPGHTYPDIIRGLNVPNFGVFNCDQIYQLQKPIQITATYKDENGHHIDGLSVLSMMDLNYNGAFSFDPKRFTCSATGKNALVLFTKSGKLYIMEPSKFKEMKISKSGAYTFTMKEMTHEIKSSDDLAKYLGITL